MCYRQMPMEPAEPGGYTDRVKNRVAFRLARNPLLTALLLLAFGTHALIPAGYMPGPGGLIVCNGHMPALGASASHAMMGHVHMPGMNMSGVGMPPGDQPAKGDGSSGHDKSTLCPFAAAATSLAGGHASVLAAVLAPVTQTIRLPVQTHIPRGTIVPNRLPRGPPSLA